MSKEKKVEENIVEMAKELNEKKGEFNKVESIRKVMDKQMEDQMKGKKISKEDYDYLNKLINLVNSTNAQIGELELKKFLLMNDAKEADKKMTDFTYQVIDKYGLPRDGVNFSINPQTLEFEIQK